MPFFIRCRMWRLAYALFREGSAQYTFYFGRSSGFRFNLLTAPSHPNLGQWQHAAFVPGYSGGTATDSHRLPI
jgi:hypothetical protein